MFKYLPNILTVLRLLLIPVIVALFFASFPNHYAWSMLVFAIAMATDVADGWMARHYRLITKLGVFLDPLADKILINVMLFACALVGILPFWLAATLFARDLISSDFKSFATHHKIHVAIAPIEGKVKAFLETVGILCAYVALQWTTLPLFAQVSVWLQLAALAVGLVGLTKMLKAHWKVVIS